MASDVVHSKDICARIVDMLQADLPSSWTTNDGTDVALKCIQHGDLTDMQINDSSQILPCILVRSLSVQPINSNLCGILETLENIRIVLIRRRQDCTDGSGQLERNMTMARQRYAKELLKALMKDPLKQMSLDGECLALTSSDSEGSNIISMRFSNLDYAGSTDDVRRVQTFGGDMWAIAVDIEVRVMNGGR